MTPLDDLKAKLTAMQGDPDRLKAKMKARQGQPGYAANLAAIEAVVAKTEGKSFVFRDTLTGEFVSTEYALANPDTTRRVEAE